RVVGPHAHIGDQELLLEHMACELEAQSAARRAARAVGRQHPQRLELIAAIRRVDFQQHGALRLAQRDELVLPTYLDQVRELCRARHQVVLDIVLLQVDERRHLVTALRQQVEAVELLVTVVDATHLPRDSLRYHALADAKSVEYLQRALRPTDGTAAGRHPVVVVEHDAAHAMQGKIDRGREPHGSCSYDDYRMLHTLATTDFRGSVVRESFEFLTIHATLLTTCADRRAAWPCRPNARWSRDRALAPRC